jgi:signal peptidase I
MTKRASAKQAFGIFCLGILAYLGMRWGGFEPYVIPSGSMIPSLLVYDHILVNKHAYGLRLPFSDTWLNGPKVPRRGDVVVFRSVSDASFFMVKRVIGLPGELITVNENGDILIDGKKVDREKMTFEEAAEVLNHNIVPDDVRDEPEVEYFAERFPEGLTHLTQHGRMLGVQDSYEVPSGHIFLMGDNRDRSQDSRFWGALPLENLLGRAQWIWLSCAEAVSQQQILCNPASIRWQRLFSTIQ